MTFSDANANRRRLKPLGSDDQMRSTEAAPGLKRFGLGARPGDIRRIAADPRGAVAAELAVPQVALLDAGLPDSPTICEELSRGMAARRALAAGKPPPEGPENAQSAGHFYAAEIAARIVRMRSAEIGFVERLVAFWTNHFAVEVRRKAPVKALAGAFEREAIRPHVLGRFEEMLIAATQHPAMLAYLDNAQSIGPDSPRGRRLGLGINENHARELMELHTVGVDGGYSQSDVTSLAEMLTGWTYGRAHTDAGRFVFVKTSHQPGPKPLMGVRYSEPGEAQALDALRQLAHNPATATHLATKMVRHFVGDNPPPALVDRLAARFVETGGDLKAMAEQLVSAPAAWMAPPRGLKPPQDFLWSSARALSIDLDPAETARILRTLGQEFWNPPSPAGFSDETAAWLAPDGLTVRLEAALMLAGQADAAGDPIALAENILGPAASRETLAAIQRAESSTQALALMLMSPDFQRR